jgi:hypothetical protein
MIEVVSSWNLYSAAAEYDLTIGPIDSVDDTHFIILTFTAAGAQTLTSATLDGNPFTVGNLAPYYGNFGTCILYCPASVGTKVIHVVQSAAKASFITAIYAKGIDPVNPVRDVNGNAGLPVIPLTITLNNQSGDLFISDLIWRGTFTLSGHMTQIATYGNMAFRTVSCYSVGAENYHTYSAATNPTTGFSVDAVAFAPYVEKVDVTVDSLVSSNLEYSHNPTISASSVIESTLSNNTLHKYTPSISGDVSIKVPSSNIVTQLYDTDIKSSAVVYSGYSNINYSCGVPLITAGSLIDVTTKLVNVTTYDATGYFVKDWIETLPSTSIVVNTYSPEIVAKKRAWVYPTCKEITLDKYSPLIIIIQDATVSAGVSNSLLTSSEIKVNTIIATSSIVAFTDTNASSHNTGTSNVNSIVIGDRRV